MLISVLLWFAVVLYTIFRNMPRKRAICLLALLVTACIPEMAVGITPTVYASILRTTIYLYMAMIVMILSIFYEIWQTPAKPGVNYFFYCCIGCGMILNAGQIARHIIRYG